MCDHDETPGSSAQRLIAAVARDERGATAVEYGLIAALIILVIVAGVGSTGGGVGAAWTSMSGKAVNAMQNAN